MKKCLKSILYVLCLSVVIHLFYIIQDGWRDSRSRADVAVVFGNKVNEDGSLSDRLQARLDQAILLYQQKRIHHIIVSGGMGKEGFFEADKMQEYLLKKQIPAEIIIVDNLGNDTELTVKNSLAIMQEKGFITAISVSQYFHQTRAKMLFRKYGFTQIESSSPNYMEWRDLYSLGREVVEFYVEWFKS